MQVAQSKEMGVCEKNCAIDYTRCLVTSFDMASCAKQDDGCAVDCLKTHEPKVAGDMCSKCIIMAGNNLEPAIGAGCNSATETTIVANC